MDFDETSQNKKGEKIVIGDGIAWKVEFKFSCGQIQKTARMKLSEKMNSIIIESLENWFFFKTAFPKTLLSLSVTTCSHHSLAVHTRFFDPNDQTLSTGFISLYITFLNKDKFIKSSLEDITVWFFSRILLFLSIIYNSCEISQFFSCVISFPFYPSVIRIHIL